MKLFRIRGGIHPEYRKEMTAGKAIEPLPMPALLHLPLQQHIGAPAVPVVAAGDRVRKGQLLARARGEISAPVHASTSGRVVDILPFAAPHPSGLPQPTILLEPDGLDEWTDLPPPLDPFAAPREEIARRVAECGVVGMGGGTFPSAVKLDLGRKFPIDVLVINGAECEPYLTCDDRLMRERTAEVVDGVRIMARALGVERIVIAIEKNKPEALAAMTAESAAFAEIAVVPLPTRYPMGSERHLVTALTGRETPARKLTADIGVVVHNIATARAVHHAVRLGRPLISRVVTVSGRAVREQKNLDVPLGTLVSQLIEFCGGLAEPPVHYLSGGPMMGQAMPGREVPVVKGTSGILALTAAEAHERDTMPCIRCGGCVTACPCGLVPVEMAQMIRHEKLDAAARIGLLDCLNCGSCAYVCPAHIPLVQYFNYGKGRLAALQRDRRKQEMTKRLAEQRAERVERLDRERKAKLAAAKKAAAEKQEGGA
ncbi:MAG: electron transport complex subunit RsxC [Alphaproteobacteria bacterium]|nr:electron transport complex subunit RsxC [Alphaproteobacteria bacterium]